MNYKELNENYHESQTSYEGWCGISDVELAREILFDIDSNFAPEDYEKIIYKISQVLKKKRSY